MGSSQQVPPVAAGSATLVEPVPSSLSRQAPAKGALPPTVAAIDAALGRLGLEIVKAAAGRRRRERGTSAEMFAFLTSYGWADALTFDEVMGLSMADAWQVLVGIGAYCPRHLAPFDGDDVNGPFCVECERGIPARTSQALRVDCEICQGSCEGRCDAGAGTFPERQRREFESACPTCHQRTVEPDCQTAPWCSQICADVFMAVGALPVVDKPAESQWKRDAIADAETLRLFAEELWRDGCGADWTRTYATEEEADMLHSRLWSADSRRGGRLWRHKRYPNAIAGRVRDYARAAFLAVPSLRGEA